MKSINSTLINDLTISTFVILILISSCNPTNSDVSSQTEKENCEYIRTTKDSLNIYYCKEYYDNGIIYREGKYAEDTAVDWHTFYNEDGSLNMKVEYAWYTGHANSQPQQIIRFEKNGDTIKSRSNYYRILCNDTIELGETFYAKIDVSISKWDSLSIEYRFDIPNDSNFVRLINNQKTTLLYDYVPMDTGVFNISGSMEIYNADSIPLGSDTVKRGIPCILMLFDKEYYVKEKNSR